MGVKITPMYYLYILVLEKLLIIIGVYKMNESNNGLPDGVKYKGYKKILADTGFSFNHIMRPDTQEMFKHCETHGYDLQGIKESVEVVVNHKKKKGEDVLPIDCRQPVDNHFTNFVKQQPPEPGTSPLSTLSRETPKIKSSPEIAEKHFKNLMRVIGSNR